MGDLSNTIIDGDPFDVHEGGEGGGFDPTSLPVSTNTPADADEIITGENGSWVRKTFAKIKEYFTTYVIGTGDSNGQIKVTPSDGTAYNVNVKGLKSAAYLDADTANTANTVVKRDANKYIYAQYYNQASSEESSATNARPCIIDGSGWHRKFSIAAFKKLIGLDGIGATATVNGSTKTIQPSQGVTDVASVSLTKGTWLLCAYAAFTPTGGGAICYELFFTNASNTSIRLVSNGTTGSNQTTPNRLALPVMITVSSTSTYKFRVNCNGVAASVSTSGWALRVI